MHINKLIDSLKEEYRRNITKPLALFLLYDLFYPNYKFRFLVWLRVCEFCRSNGKVGWCLYPLAKFFWHKYSLKGNIEIGFNSVAPGVKIVHNAGSIIINSNARIGERCQLSPGVIVGISSIKRKNEVPIIGFGVYLAPNCKVFGKSIIGDNVIVGTDTIIRDKIIPSNSIVYGNPLVVKPKLK